MRLECGCVRELLTHGEEICSNRRSENDLLLGVRRVPVPRAGVAMPCEEIVEWVESETNGVPPNLEESLSLL